jgi:hypothetical protein
LSHCEGVCNSLVQNQSFNAISHHRHDMLAEDPFS